MAEREPVKPVFGAKPIAPLSLVASLRSFADSQNENFADVQYVSYSTIDEIIAREEHNGDAVVQRAVANFFATVENPATKRPTQHTDLLPEGHPLSTRWVSSFQKRAIVASYMAQTAEIEDEVRPILASALKAEPNTATRKFYEAKLKMHDKGFSTEIIISTADKAISA
jgi:hypothetical protein